MIEHGDRRYRAEAEDLSQKGAFVRTEEQFPVGTELGLEIALPSGPRLALTARVAHRLAPSSAEALARSPGMGLRFLEPSVEARSRLAAFLGRVTIEVLSAPAPDVRGAFFVIAHHSEPLARRIANILEGIGCEYAVASDGISAFDACQERRPDCIVAELELPGTDGLGLLTLLADSFELVDVPVVLLGENATPNQRLRAYRLGTADLIPTPFSDEEVSIRLRRAVAFGLRSHDTAVLRGRLADIKLTTLLSMFEFERKTGIVTVRSPDHVGRLYLREGRVLRAELGAIEARAALEAMLEWPAGELEFVACPVVIADEDGIAFSELAAED